MDCSNQKATCILGLCVTKELECLDKLEKKQVDDMMKRFLATMCDYLLKNLPLDNPVIKDARYLHPFSQDDDKAADAIERLTKVIWDALGLKAVLSTFGMQPNSTKYQLIDVVKRELEEFRLERLPKKSQRSLL